MSKVKINQLFSKAVVVFVIIINILFTWRVLEIFLVTATEPTTLIVTWFGFTTGELWLLANIKKKKIQKEENQYGKFSNCGDAGDLSEPSSDSHFNYSNKIFDSISKDENV